MHAGRRSEVKSAGAGYPGAAQGPNADKTLRVLLDVHDLLPGASSVPLDAFEWMKAGIVVHTVALRGGFLENRYRQLGTLDVVPEWELPLHTRIGRQWFLRRLRRRVSRFQPHLLYVNSVVSLQPAKVLNFPVAPVLIHVHELESYLEPVLADNTGLFRNWPNRYVAVSEAVRQVLIKRAGIPEAKIGLVHAFIRDEMLSRGIEPHGSASGDPAKPFVIGGAGALSWRKGITLWLQMVAAVLRLLPKTSLEFRWVGILDNADGHAALVEARKLGLADIVKFLPFTDRPLDEFRQFDVFAMTSWEDPCPLVVLENMALGKPVLCFEGSGGAPGEIGSSGVIIQLFSPEAMAVAIAELAQDGTRREALGKAARSRVGQMFVASVQAPKLLEEMRRVATRDDTLGSRG